MKYSPEDFKDRLSGYLDKPAAIADIKQILAKAGLIVKVSRRKLATGVKIYFTVSPPESVGSTSSWYEGVASVRNYSVDVIQKHFPLAGVTSGGPSGWTIAEY